MVFEGPSQRKAKRPGRNLRCEDPLDYRATDCKDRLVAQDKASPISGTNKKETSIALSRRPS